MRHVILGWLKVNDENNLQGAMWGGLIGNSKRLLTPEQSRP